MRLPAVPGEAGDRAVERGPLLPLLRQIHPGDSGVLTVQTLLCTVYSTMYTVYCTVKIAIIKQLKSYHLLSTVKIYIFIYFFLITYLYFI